MLTFTTFFPPLVLLYLDDLEQPVPLEGDGMHRQVCGTLQPPCLGEQKDFDNFVCTQAVLLLPPTSLSPAFTAATPRTLFLFLSSSVSLFTSLVPSHAKDNCTWTKQNELSTLQSLKLKKQVMQFSLPKLLKPYENKAFQYLFWNKTLWLRESRTSHLHAQPQCYLQAGYFAGVWWNWARVCSGTHFSSSYKLRAANLKFNFLKVAILTNTTRFPLYDKFIYMSSQSKMNLLF